MRSIVSLSQNAVTGLPVSEETGESAYVFPASFGQQQLWLLDRLLGGRAVYNVPAVVRVVGALDIDALQGALHEVVGRHEVLRTRFEVEDAMPVQVIASEVAFKLELEDLSALPAREGEAEARRRAQEEAAQPFDLEHGPLLRARLLRLGESEHWLLLTLHHIVTDGWSSGVMRRELSVLYEAFHEGRPARLPELPVQYADYAVWQREWLQGDALAEQLSYWKQALADLPVLDLPTDRPPPAVASYRGGRLAFELGEDLTRGLKELNRREGTTLFMTLLAAFQVLLYRYSGQEDVAVGVPVAGRRRPELEGLIGYFVNMLVLRGDMSGQPSFKEYLARVRTQALAAYAHQDMPFAKLVEELAPKRSLSRNPLFQVSFVVQNTPSEALQLAGLEVQVIKGIHGETAKFDLDFSVTEEQEKIRIAIEYATDLFDASTIERMAGHWRVLLEGIVADPAQRISHLPLLTEAEQQQLRAQWNATAYSRDTCVHQLFEEQVRRTPQATALVFEEQRLTYAELNARANQLAHHLRTLGVGPEVLVAIAMERSLELIVGLLGILKAGGAYVPLDSSYPAERLAFMLSDTQAPVLLTQQRLLGHLPAHAGQTLCLDRDWASIAEHPESNPIPSSTADNLAYVIYTSGSTGLPKGTLVTHRNVARLFAATEHWFEFDARDVWTGFHSVAFDFSVWEIWGALIYGGKLVLVPYLVSRDPHEFHALLSRERVTVLNQTPSAFRQLMGVDALEDVGEKVALRFVILGGEPLDFQSLRPWFERHGDAKPQVVNMYGITETTVHATYRPVAIADLDAATSSLIGEPIPDLDILLLDSHLQPVPVGIAGELFVAGAGVARGYLNRPELTAERFIANPFSTDPTSRLYRSGDIARRTSDNDLAYLGRMDLQIKIRGHRVELAEIESVLSQHPEVEQAVVVAGADPRASHALRLIAYVLPAASQVGPPVAPHPALGNHLTADLRAHLKARLPEFMLPSVFVSIDEVPLTANGKVDRKRLPVPGTESFAVDDAQYVAPRDGVEEQLAAIFGELLGLERVGVHSDFFELGGDSLLAVQTLWRVETVLGISLSVRSLFAAPTVASLARQIEVQRASAGGPHRTGPSVSEIRSNPRVSVPEKPTGAVPVFPPSFGQQQLWLLDRLLGGRAVYNVPAVVRVVGALDIDALQGALHEVVGRHEVLRTRFEVEDAMPVQVIASEVAFKLELEDLSALPAREGEAEARRRAQEEAAQPFDLEHGPLLRARLLRLGESEHWLLLTLHHIVTDGWSSGVMRRELSVLYEAFHEGRPARLPELPVQYADYAVWQREWLQGDALAEQLSYWKQALADLPVLDLPTDRPPPAVASYRGGRLAFELGEDLTRGLKELNRREGTTLFMTLLAAFQVLLYRYSGQEDVAVGVPVAGRRRPELEGLIGYFVNMLVLRGDMSGQPSFKEYLARVRTQALAAYAHQDMPFAKLVEELAPKRSLSRNPLFQVSFVVQNTPSEALQLAGLEVQVIKGIHGETAKFDLDFSVTEEQEKIRIAIEYATDLFDASTIERMAGHWRVLLEGIVADPAQRISHLPLLTEAEQQQLRAQWNATAYSRDTCVHQLFEEQVRRTPQATALVFEEQRLTYAELNARANQLAHHLRTLGVGPEVLVAIAMERSLELIVGLLGILKAGGAYVPLDSSYPAERLAFMLSDTQAPVLLTQQRLLGHLPAHAGQTLCLDRDWASIAEHPESNPIPSSTADNLAYVIYTSGSTGLPKGVMVEHRSVVNYLSWIGEAFPLDGADRVLQKTPISFDASVEEICFPLTRGAVLVIAGRDAHRSVVELIKILQRQKIRVLQVVPSLLASIVDHEGFRGCESLRLILCGAEALSTDLVRRVCEQSSAEVVNLYGPTETTISSTFWRCRPEALRASVPVGRPIANTNAVVVDRAGQWVPAGVVGELYLGGAGVARGYLNRPELTRECFVADPFSTDARARLYRTGDLVRYLPDGNLEFLGRRDQQVKIRGFRIELAEVEAVLKQHATIRDAVVLARQDRPGEKRLVAYIVPAPGQQMIASELRGFLLRKLPDYMVPAAFLTLRALPLTASGKVDRTLLSASTAELAPATRAPVPPRNAVEVQLMRIWERILDVSPIGMQDNFFALGGDSLAAVRVIDRVEQLFARQLPPDILWYQEGTIESLARALVDDSEPPLWSGPVAIKATGKRRPLFCPHIVGGHLFFYDNLARHLTEDQPLYGLPARGVDGKTPPDTTIEAMAAHCIQSMLQIQPRGPYRLAGYCSGGIIAFEMARQLRAQGQTTELLALCDSLAPGFRPLELARTAWNFLRLKNVRLVQQRVYRFVLQNLGLSHLRKFRTVTEAHYWAYLSYRPQAYPGHAVLFKASTAGDPRRSHLGWERLAEAGLDIRIIPCGHAAMVKEPTVRVLAEKLETYLEALPRSRAPT